MRLSVNNNNSQHDRTSTI